MPVKRHRVAPAMGLIIGVLALLAALAVPLAPVIGDRVTVTWPQAGALPQSTVAFVVPYHPNSVQVRVPCSVVRAAQERDVATTVVASRPPGQPTEGFAVTTAGNTVLALAGGREVLRAPIGPNCAVAIDGDAHGSTARIGDQQARIPERIRDIVAFATDLSPAQADGIRVQVDTANWFANAPTEAKKLLITVQLLLVVAAFVVLWRLDARRVRNGSAPLPTRLTHRLVGFGIDALVAALLIAWWILGPNGPDDSFAAMTVHAGLQSGDITNYYRWENASEAPFTLVQRLLEPVAQWNPNGLALRIPSVLAAFGTWLLLARGILGAVLPGQHRRPMIRLLAGMAFLAWWLPFGLTIRPEPFEALCLAAVLAAVLQAVRTDRTVWLGVAALAAGLSVATSPMGLAAVAPFIVLAPRLRTLMTVPVAAMLAGIAATGVVAMFAEQSLAGARKATELHTYYGPNVPWFQEIERYQYLLGFDLQGDVARRAAVLLTLVVAGYSLLLLLRGAGREPGLRLVHVPAACLLVSMALMTLTPSKWTHYFGALVAFGAATLTVGVVLAGIAAATALADRVVLLGAGVFTLVIAGTAALVFAGENSWFLHSQLGVLWGEGPIRPLNNPLIWLALAALLLSIAALVRRQRSGLIRLPTALGAVATGLAVLLVFGSFVLAPIRQGNGYSIGGQNLTALGAGGCGLGDKVMVTPESPGSALTGGDNAEMAGFRPEDGALSAAPEGVRYWGSLAGGGINTGTLTTGWFQLPRLHDDQQLAVSVAGRSGDGNRVELEFDTGARITLDDAWIDDHRDTYPADHVIDNTPQDHPSWRDITVPARDIPPSAQRVRIHATDATTDPAGWTAVAAPRVRQVVPMSTYLRGKGPILPDWSMAWNVPCVQNFPQVRDGLVQPPAYLITPPRSTGFGGEAAYLRSIGGSFAGVRDLGTQQEIPTQLVGARKTPGNAEWGHLIEVKYPYPSNGFTVNRVAIQRWGWRGE